MSEVNNSPERYELVMTISEEESKLIEAINGGEKERFAELIRQYSRLCLHFFLVKCGKNLEIARDLTQEAFIRAYTGLNRFTPGRSFKPWLMGICNHIALDHQRSISVRQRNKQVPPQPPSPGEGVETRALVEAAMETLAGRQREVVEMFYFLDLTCGEIAEALEVPLGTVKSDLFQARLTMLEFFQRE